MESTSHDSMHRSPFDHDCGFTVLCGASDPGSTLHSLHEYISMLSMIVDIAFRQPARSIDLVAAAEHGHMAELRAKLQLTDVDVNAQEDARGRSVVHIAACHGQTEMFRLLLQCGGVPNRANPNGNTAVHTAAANGHTDAIQLLLQSGGDPNWADNYGHSPMRYAAQYSRIQQLLQSAGGKTHQPPACRQLNIR